MCRPRHHHDGAAQQSMEKQLCARQRGSPAQQPHVASERARGQFAAAWNSGKWRAEHPGQRAWLIGSSGVSARYRSTDFHSDATCTRLQSGTSGKEQKHRRSGGLNVLPQRQPERGDDCRCSDRQNVEPRRTCHPLSMFKKRVDIGEGHRANNAVQALGETNRCSPRIG